MVNESRLQRLENPLVWETLPYDGDAGYRPVSEATATSYRHYGLHGYDGRVEIVTVIIILTKLPTTCVYGAGILADSLKSHQEWASVWRAKCKEFVKKIKDFRCVRCGRFGGFAEFAPRVAPSMESNM